MTLKELKEHALSLGLTPDEVRQHGNLSKKATWEKAIAEFEEWKKSVEDLQDAGLLPDLSYSDDEPQSEPEPTNDELPFDPTHTLIDGEWVKIEETPVSNSVTLIQYSLIPPIDVTVDMDGWYRWDENLKVWIKENPEETLKDCYQPESESYRQQLLKRMQPYVGDCIKPEDFEQLQNEPLDETTASVYLGLLDGSERVLSGLITP